MNKLSIWHVIESLYLSNGGPSRTVTQLAQSLIVNSKLDVRIFTQALVGHSSTLAISDVPTMISESKHSISLKFGLPLRRSLHDNAKSSFPDLIHSHGVWSASNHWAAKFSEKNNVPLIIHPRGMLEPWSMNYKFLKKKLALAAYQMVDLQSASLLVATALSEYKNLRSLGFKQPIAIIPNGFNLSDCESSSLMIKAKERTRTVLFLSRIHKKKGLFNLVDAWSEMRPKGWRLKIAGPDEGGHLFEVLKHIKSAGLEDDIDYLGEVDGFQKGLLYQESDIFVLPTYSENFGLVILEALSHGVPVITTNAAPWSDLELFGCGWWIDVGVRPLVVALTNAIALSDNDRFEMGSRGRLYAARYNWDDISREMTEVYKWVLGRSEKPKCIHTD